MWEIARIIHQADLADERHDAPEAVGLDVVLRGTSYEAPGAAYADREGLGGAPADLYT